MVKIRLQRKGARNAPFYRIVVADSRSPRDGKFIESIGYYDSTKDPYILKIDADKAINWLAQGAQPTDTVRSFLRQAGVLQKWHEAKQRQAAEKS